MSPPLSSNRSNASWRDLVNGATLQCLEAATLGMPFEVWKTRMARWFMVFHCLRRKEELSLGTYAYLNLPSERQESILSSMQKMGFGETISGFAAGAGGGISQTVVIGPCTFLVTAVVTGADKNVRITQKIGEVWKTQGVQGFYSGSTAIALRQASNWASRQGLTEFVRSRIKIYSHGSNDATLSVGEETLSGILGGALSTWNQPFEVARVYMQSRANDGQSKQNIYRGIIPRMGLAIWQTLFMVTGVKVLKQYLL